MDMLRTPIALFASLALVSALVTGCSSSSADLTLSGSGDGKLSVDFAAKGTQLTLDGWAKLADATGGKTYESRGSTDIPDLVVRAIADGVPPSAKADIVFVVDTTGSMQDDIDAVKAKLRVIVAGLAKTNPDFHVGVAAYRDKGDDYVSKTFEKLTSDEGDVTAAISSLKAAQGGDFREHVYAGLDTALEEQPWRSDSTRVVILIGDAPPHDSYKDDPRNFDAVVAKANAKGVSVFAIGVYCDTACQVLVSALDSLTGGEK